ncbi:MAG: response regulator receiver [Gemmatimonadetes bacterium]|nr:response regulator receiver [Gemmatimonadota bacterium]
MDIVNARKTQHILIIEDNEDLAFGLRRSLEGEGYEVTIAADGAAGLERAHELRPDLLLLDLMLPGGMDGYRTLIHLRNGGLEMPVLILTARGEESDKVHGFRLGADDYVVKPFGLSELLARVKALLRRTRPSEEPEERFTFGDVIVDPAGRIVTRAGERVSLTPREFDLLLALVRRPGVVWSRVALLRTVWAHQADVLTRTVDIHIGELRRKLEPVPASPRYFVTVWKSGYRFDP